MAKLVAICAALLSCLAFAPVSASASATPSQSQPPWFTVQWEKANGTGCPPGSTAVNQQNNTQFTVIYSNYVTFAGRGASPLDFRKNCQLDVRVGVPSGWTYGIFEVDYRGYAHLDTGANGLLQADYYFAGYSPVGKVKHPLYGPMDDTYSFTDMVPAVAYAPCHFNATLNIDTSARVSAGSTPTFTDELTVDSHDISTHTVYHIAFRQC